MGDNHCLLDNGGCPCAEYAKEMLCDYPHRNSESEIKAIKLWGHRLPYVGNRSNKPGKIGNWLGGLVE